MVKENNNEIIIYQAPDGKTKIDVKFQDESVWLTQAQLVDLFQSSKANISEHITNIFLEEELDENSTVRKFRTVQKEGSREVARDLAHYNLEMIISVGYRVKSLRATHFRVWATNVLKKHLTEGYTINEKRLKEAREKYAELQKPLSLLSENISKAEQVSDEAKGILKVLDSYSKALDILDGYDHQTLKTPKGRKQEKNKLTYKKSLEIVNAVKTDFSCSALMGLERDRGLESIINDIYQTFNGEDIYPTVQEKSANLLYLVTKNHCFADGNKRIAAGLFISYLQ